MTHAFLPPYLLQRLATADENDADPPRRSLALDARLRDGRERQTATVRRRVTGEGRRLIHTANNTETLPGDVVRREGDGDTGDAAVDEAYVSSGLVWDLFAEAFGRESFDGQGSTISVTVHYGERYDNAFWDGQQLVFGDGDGQIFDRFTKPMDVLSHEFSHGFVQYTTAFTYQGQSGALNESIADVFAAMAKQRQLGQSAEQANWLIGEGLFLPGVKARALRSMIEPGTAYDDERLGRDPQVGSMADYIETTEDNGGVHLNSGIPNRAFALAANAIGGPSWEKAGRVWFDTMTAGGLTAETDFTTFAEATVVAADRVFPDDPSVREQVRSGWVTVRVLTANPDTASSDSGTTDPGTTDPAPSAPRQVEVRRSGGFAGVTRQWSVDLDDDPAGPELRSLLRQVNPAQIDRADTASDRFTYTVSWGSVRVTMSEQALTPELDRVVRIVQDRSGLDLD